MFVGSTANLIVTNIAIYLQRELQLYICYIADETKGALSEFGKEVL